VPLAYLPHLAQEQEARQREREEARLRRRQELAYLQPAPGAAAGLHPAYLQPGAAPPQRRRHSTTSSTWALQSHLMALEQLAAAQQEALDLEPFQQHLQHHAGGARRYSADSSALALRTQRDVGLQLLQPAGWGQAGPQGAGVRGGAAPDGGASAQGQAKAPAAQPTYIGIRMFQ
jgi:hypothetical protein